MFRKILTYCLFLAVGLLLNSCITNRTTRYLQNIERGYAKAERYPEYRIQPNDVLQIRVFSSKPEAFAPFLGNSQSAAQGYPCTVKKDSTIALFFMPRIKVGGLTLLEAETVVHRELQAFVKDTFAIKLAQNNKVFYMLGEGGRGQVQTYKDRMTIFEALALGGDLNLAANRKKVKIMRNMPEGMKIMEFDLRSKDIVDSEYYYILPNDIIYAERTKKSFFFQINSFSSFLSAITSSVSFVLLVLQYSTTK